MKYILMLISTLHVRVIFGDLATNCTYEETVGSWTLYVGPRNFTNKINCNKVVEPVQKINVVLSFPNVAKDDDGNTGTWTMIYNQG